MADDETTRANQSIRLGKLAGAAPHDQAKQLVNTQANKGSDIADVEGVIQKATNARALGSFKKGGKVKRTGTYKLHKGEKVLTAKKASKRG